MQHKKLSHTVGAFLLRYAPHAAIEHMERFVEVRGHDCDFHDATAFPHGRACRERPAERL